MGIIKDITRAITRADTVNRGVTVNNKGVTVRVGMVKVMIHVDRLGWEDNRGMILVPLVVRGG